MINKIGFKFFVPYKQVEFSFKKGINIILGKNRSGKSQILEGISFAYFGRTKNSKIEYIIRPGADSAEVSLDHTDLKLKRIRTKLTSRLTGITKVELESKLNLSYLEFLRMFYISSSESFALFDTTYFRTFLIGLFDLERYAKVYKKLNDQYKILNEIIAIQPVVNRELYSKRLKRVQDFVAKCREKKKPLESKENKLRGLSNTIYTNQGVLQGKVANYNKHKVLLELNKCPKCYQDVPEKYKKELIARLKELRPKLKQAKEQLDKQSQETRIKVNGVRERIDIIDNRINKGRTLEYVIKEKLSQKETKRNTKRIKELEKILPIFNPKGFPSYLLQAYIPVIQETANNLLHMIFPDVTIKVRTTKPDGHTPDLKVMITKDNRTMELKDYAGSETVLINLCLRLGVLIIFKQLNNTSIDFMLLDESMEKLDDDVSLQVIQLLRNFIHMGYLNQIILVTHKEKLKDLNNVHYIKLEKK